MNDPEEIQQAGPLVDGGKAVVLNQASCSASGDCRFLGGRRENA